MWGKQSYPTTQVDKKLSLVEAIFLVLVSFLM